MFQWGDELLTLPFQKCGHLRRFISPSCFSMKSSKQQSWRNFTVNTHILLTKILPLTFCYNCCIISVHLSIIHSDVFLDAMQSKLLTSVTSKFSHMCIIN